MAVNRIRVAKDKAELVRSLLDTKDTTGPFQTYADVIAFAAALGISRKKRSPVTDTSKNEPSPIAVEIFISRGYDFLIKLLAISETKDPKILSTVDGNAENERINIFEEYANGGLEILREELRGSVDYTERLLLVMSAERFKTDTPPGEFDLSRFL